MELQIQKIYPNELPECLKSVVYANPESLPISQKRVNSYFQNPNKYKNLPVLYLGYHDGKLICYRSLLQDKIKAEKSLPIAWLSGVWVHPQFRRKGLANKLLDEVYRDYQGRILSTNLGANSLQLMEGNPKFTLLNNLQGKRFYYRFSLTKILPVKSYFFKKIRPILQGLDFVGNLILNLKPGNKHVPIHLEDAEVSEELNEFIRNYNSDSLLKRNGEELNWILKYPWVEQKTKEDFWDSKYHFTTTSKVFYQRLKVIRKTGEIKGFLMYSVRNGTLKVHYLFADSTAEVATFTYHLIEIIRKEKLDCLLTTEPHLIELLTKNKSHIYSKDWIKKYFIGKNFLNAHPDWVEKTIYLGDGDTVFV